MREILFRGKRTDNGEWVEGSLVHQTLYYGDPVDRYHIIYDGEFDCDYYNNKIVVPETVGQYTGLTDKNGTKIFEGDILQFGGNRRFFHVEFLEGEFIVIESKRPPHIWSVPIASCISQVEVIGNIHDNPELLKGGD